MRKWWVYGAILAGVVVASLGLLRLKFDTDILSMLPGELPEVRGLKAFHQTFSREDEVILLIEAGQEGADLPAAAESLSQALLKDGVVKQARWQPRWMQDPEGLSELLAYLWLNGEESAAQELSARLQPGKSEAVARETLESLATAINGEDIAIKAHDPYGFLAHPAVASLMASAEHGGGAFASGDGQAHLLFVEAPQPIHGYREAATWLAGVRKTIAAWQQGEGSGFKVGLTGEPAFSSEIGGAMETDLNGSIGVTLALIAVLFWWMQRRLMLLLGLNVILVLVFAVALGLAGWIYGELSIMALSSAEILIGLATDYGLVICQEAKVAGHDRKALLAASGRPVLCGALTTTMVFLALNLGGLPGMAQLGTIVAVGLAAAAVLMIALYLPWVVRFGVDRQPADDEPHLLPRRRGSWWITGLLSAAGIVVLIVCGLPGAEFDSKIMRPRHSASMETFERLQVKFPDQDPRMLKMVVEAPDDATMLARLAEAGRRTAAATGEGVLAKASLPVGWWPDAQRQERNRAGLAALASQRDRLMAEADAAGFAEEGTGLTKTVLSRLATMTSGTAVAFPESETAREVMRLFLKRNENGGGFMLGSVLPAPGVDPEREGYPRIRTLSGDGIWLSGWGLFKPAIAGLVKEDLTRMLLPMGLVLLAMMALIFRRVKDVWLALFTMIVSAVLLLAIMKLCGLKWNFVNLMATPLLLGTGIDYAIHVTLTLRRTGGCFKELWNGTGKALLFCGASNVIGFGSLCFSSSDALVSLGIVAVIGILLSMAVSIFLLPGWHGARERERAMLKC